LIFERAISGIICIFMDIVLIYFATFKTMCVMYIVLSIYEGL